MSNSNEDFLCGVVEGFYSRPWTTNQRLDLYGKMKTFGLNTYVYAPKDDAKHRALWRQPYSESEMQFLQRLISRCQETNVTFVYGISPGLDIAYSQTKEVDLLKSKLDQLKNAGCSGFCLLWDDIDTTLPPEDADAFGSLAEAQIAISNKVFAHLGRPSSFLFCPTEYCASRADPNVRKSDYLSSLGRGLDKEIKVFWTGAKVVSEKITLEEIKEVGQVLQRKPLIWDNLHANDYDQQRLFLGPFKGRCPNLIPYLSGVLTNPNCEYSFNIPVLFTLGSWYRSHLDNCGEWNPMQASKEAIPHFIAEINRKTSCGLSSGSDGENQEPRGNPEDEFKEAEIELLFHLYWLPHSHGPKAQLILDEFDFLKKNANLMLDLSPSVNQDEHSDDEDTDSDTCFTDASKSSFVLEWMRRFSVFNDSCRKIFRMLDKWTYVANRELFFDLNPYLNNLQVILRASIKYLKWVCHEKCSRPLNGGPTLAGLIGGFAGDMQRLYPIQSARMFPLHSATASHEYLIVRPLLSREKSQIPTFVRNMSDSVDHMVVSTKSMTRIFANCIADQSDAKGFVVEDMKKGVMAFIVVTKQVSSLLKAVKKHMTKEKVKEEKLDVLSKQGLLATFFSTRGLFYSKALRSMIEAFFEAYVDDNANFGLIVDKYEDLVLSFLSDMNMRKTHETNSFIVIKKNAPSKDK